MTSSSSQLVFNKRIYFVIIWILLTGVPGCVKSQGLTISGKVTDKQSGDPLAFVTVSTDPIDRSCVTNEKGNYYMHSANVVHQVIFSVIGYKSLRLDIKPGKQIIDVELIAEAEQLPEIVVKSGGRKKYRIKDNPAVELIKQVIGHKTENRMENYDYTEFHQYESMMMSLAHLSDSFPKKKVFKNYQFLFKKQDSNAIGGKLILPLYLEEKSSDNYFRKYPRSRKQIVKAFKQVKYDEDFIDNKGLSTFLNFLYQDVNIYDNNILLLTNQLLSPIANGAPSFYQYFIIDTLKDVTPQLIKLSFRPKNSTDLLFQGTLYITLDGHFAVKNAILRTNSHINLNFIRQMETRLSFDKIENGGLQLTRSELKIDFGITKGKTTGMFGQRLINRDHVLIDKKRPDSIYSGPEMVILPRAEEKDSAFWSSNRRDTTASTLSSVYKNLDSMQTIPSYKRNMTIASVLLSGYKKFGIIEVGPVNSFYSFNPVEGNRFRLGGRTTTNLSQRYYFEGYGAYGTKDEKFKYFASATYSLNNKSIYSFPQKFIRASYEYDTKIPGEDLSFVQDNNFLLSFKRGNNDQWTYNKIFKLDYINEFDNHFSYLFEFKYWNQIPAGSLQFNQALNTELVAEPSITTSELSLSLRYAPHEKFYQGKLYRTPLTDRYPVISLKYAQGVKNLLGSQYSYENVTLNITKRFYLSQLGYTNVMAEGGYIFGQVPFPLLTIHRANQTYSLQPEAYNLMNFLEFVSDHYAAVNIEQNFNGFFFNKVPFFNKLKWREIIGAKILWGGLRNENNPSNNPNLLLFPVNAKGVPTTYILNSGPYIEGSIGIGNIFKLLRVDLVKRFTYLDNPQVSPLGVRATIKIDF